MSHILKISEAASLAFHTMALLAAEPSELFSTHQIALIMEISENHLAKVLQRLTKAGLVTPSRGPLGGFKINRLPEEVTLQEIYEVIEGPMVMPECLLSGKRHCNGLCVLGDLLRNVDLMVHEYLGKTRLSDLAGVFRPRLTMYRGGALSGKAAGNKY
jgi:Rrf2 family protein